MVGGSGKDHARVSEKKVGYMLGERRERLPVEHADDAVGIELGAGLELATLLFVFKPRMPSLASRVCRVPATGLSARSVFLDSPREPRRMVGSILVSSL
jgi:hypothetical protein